MPDGEREFLATVPLLRGLPSEALDEVARACRRRSVRAGEVLWRQGDDSRDMLFIADGGVSASLHLAGDRVVEIWRGRRGDTVGEIALLDGGAQTATVRVTEDATVLALGRVDLVALLSRRHPSAFALKRRLTAVLTARLRNQLRYLAGSLGDEAPAAAGTLGELEWCSPPDSAYLRRMAAFHDFDPLAVWGFLTSGRYARCAPGRTLLAEGEESTACCLTINGAVEKVIARGGRRIRIGLAGPGKAFGYEGLIDGLPSPVTITARERALLLVLPREPFAQLLAGEDAISRMVLDVIQRDIVATLRQSLQPLARQVGASAA